jgi:signal peptidase I
MDFTTGKRVLAALFSAIVPGSGQLLKRETKKAILYLTAFVILLLLDWPLRAPETYIGLMMVKIGATCLALVASLDAFLAGSAKGPRYLIVLPILAALILGDAPVSLIVLAEGFHIYYSPTTSMEPSVLKGDRVVADQQYYVTRVPQRGDVVVLRHNVLAMKRVVAVEGDKIQGVGDQIWLNGQLLSEPNVQHIVGPAASHSEFGPIRVLPGSLFVMGDNRDVSFDSRQPGFGQVSSRDILGKALYVYTSKVPGRWGKKIE